MRRTPVLTALAVCLAAPAIAAAIPAGPPPVTPPPGMVCTPSAAWVATAAGERWLTPPSSTCGPEVPTPGVPTINGDGPLVRPDTPRLVLEPGERVTFHFAAAPIGVVTLRALAGPRDRAGRGYRLSSTAPTWRARPGSGVLVITITQASPLGGTAVAAYSAVYRTTSRPVVPGDPPAAVRRRTVLPSCGIERLRHGDDRSASAPRVCLRAAVAAGRTAELISVRPTIEGDPVTTIVRLLAARRVQVIIDATADRFGGGAVWTSRICTRLDPTTLVTTGCGRPTRL